jgi:hypothetical protein
MEIIMETTTHLLLFISVAFFFVHELDAIQQHEWRFFFASTPLVDNRAYQLFTALHIPLFIFIMWNLPSLPFKIGFDLFMIGHAALHFLLRNHPNVNFNNWFSRLWIFGGAFFGATHLYYLLR